MVTLGHLSDLHATPVRVERWRDFANKRLLGLLSWRVKRGKVYRPEVLEALLVDLAAAAPDHVAVTGDLTNVATLPEFGGARAWLERIGSPERVSLVPGNHDAYVRVPREVSWDQWSAYLESDGGEDPSRFPTLRVRGALALVGVCTAAPTPPFFATGAVGREQLERLEKLLTGLSDSGLCRVILIHHPPTEGATSARRSLTDAAAFRGVLGRTGADLVLHGHGHRPMFGAIDGPRAPIPVVGVPAASNVGSVPIKRSRYHLYDIEPAADGAGFRIALRIRGYDPESGGFAAEGERVL